MDERDERGGAAQVAPRGEFPEGYSVPVMHPATPVRWSVEMMRAHLDGMAAAAGPEPAPESDPGISGEPADGRSPRE